jgi:hypothetical protein
MPSRQSGTFSDRIKRRLFNIFAAPVSIRCHRREKFRQIMFITLRRFSCYSAFLIAMFVLLSTLSATLFHEWVVVTIPLGQQVCIRATRQGTSLKCTAKSQRETIVPKSETSEMSSSTIPLDSDNAVLLPLTIESDIRMWDSFGGSGHLLGFRWECYGSGGEYTREGRSSVTETRVTTVVIPSWTAMPLLAWWPIVSILSRRKANPNGQCAQCGYDLRASTDRCPECGMAISIMAETKV